MNINTVLIMFFFTLNICFRMKVMVFFQFQISTIHQVQSLGGSAIAFYDNDVSISSNVPSLLNENE